MAHCSGNPRTVWTLTMADQITMKSWWAGCVIDVAQAAVMNPRGACGGTGQAGQDRSGAVRSGAGRGLGSGANRAADCRPSRHPGPQQAAHLLVPAPVPRQRGCRAGGQYESGRRDQHARPHAGQERVRPASSARRPPPQSLRLPGGRCRAWRTRCLPGLRVPRRGLASMSRDVRNSTEDSQQKWWT